MAFQTTQFPTPLLVAEDLRKELDPLPINCKPAPWSISMLRFIAAYKFSRWQKKQLPFQLPKVFIVEITPARNQLAELLVTPQFRQLLAGLRQEQQVHIVCVFNFSTPDIEQRYKTQHAINLIFFKNIFFQLNCLLLDSAVSLPEAVWILLDLTQNFLSNDLQIIFLGELEDHLQNDHGSCDMFALMNLLGVAEINLPALFQRLVPIKQALSVLLNEVYGSSIKYYVNGFIEKFYLKNGVKLERDSLFKQLYDCQQMNLTTIARLFPKLFKAAQSFNFLEREFQGLPGFADATVTRGSFTTLKTYIETEKEDRRRLHNLDSSIPIYNTTIWRKKASLREKVCEVIQLIPGDELQSLWKLALSEQSLDLLIQQMTALSLSQPR